MSKRINQLQMNNAELVLYENITQSDLDFRINTDLTSFPSSAISSTNSTLSDAESAPIDFNNLFNKICAEYTKCVHETGRVLPPEWTMPELVRTLLWDDVLQQGSLTDAYYDVMLCGTRSWGCEELLNLLDLINYV